jgi:precorrin-4 methylase
MRIFSSPEVKAERARLDAIHEARRQSRFDEGDPGLRKTIFGNIKQLRTGGIPVKSIEGIRYAYAATALPQAVGQMALHDTESAPRPEEGDCNPEIEQ